MTKWSKPQQVMKSQSEISPPVYKNCLVLHQHVKYISLPEHWEQQVKCT